MTDPPKEEHWNLYYIFLSDQQIHTLPPDFLTLLHDYLFPKAQD